VSPASLPHSTTPSSTSPISRMSPNKSINQSLSPLARTCSRTGRRRKFGSGKWQTERTPYNTNFRARGTEAFLQNEIMRLTWVIPVAVKLSAE
jgi:hypothetical protein